MDGKRHAIHGDHADGHQILRRIERQLLHVRQDRNWRATGKIKRISVIARACSVFGTDRSPCPAAVLDDKRLPVRLGQTVTEQPGDDIGDPPCAVGDDDLDRTVRPILRPRLDIAEYQGCA
jgi:hypothetical protein